MSELRKALHQFGIGSIESVDELKSGDIVKYRRKKTPYDPTYDKGGEPFREPWRIGRVRNIADKTPFYLQEGRCVTIDERVKKRKEDFPVLVPLPSVKLVYLKVQSKLKG